MADKEDPDPMGSDDQLSGGEERDSFVESIESNEFVDSHSNSDDEET